MNSFEILKREIAEYLIRTKTKETRQVLSELQNFAKSLGNDWISVDDELPESDGLYLIYGFDNDEGYCEQRIEFFIKKNNDFITDLTFTVTHWQPLPRPPKD